MQQATVQMGKIAIQALVNTMGVSVAAAFAVVNRIDDFAITPEQNIAHAMTALMAQNKGAGKNDRMREGFRCGMILELVYGAAVMLIDPACTYAIFLIPGHISCGKKRLNGMHICIQASIGIQLCKFCVPGITGKSFFLVPESQIDQ